MDDGSGGDRGKMIECALCSQPPIDPLSLLRCGHHFCKECFRRDENSPSRCPNCRIMIEEGEVKVMDQTMQQIVFQLFPHTLFETLERRRKTMRDHSLDLLYPRWLVNQLDSVYDPEERVVVEVEWVGWPNWENLTMTAKRSRKHRSLEEISIDSERATSSNDLSQSLPLSDSTTDLLPKTFRRHFRIPAKANVSSLAKILEKKLETPLKNAHVHFFSPCFNKVVEPTTKLGDIMLQQKGGRFRRIKLAFACMPEAQVEHNEQELETEMMPVLEAESSGEEALPSAPELSLEVNPPAPVDPLPVFNLARKRQLGPDGIPKKLIQTSNAAPRKRRKPSSPTKRVPDEGSPPPTPSLQSDSPSTTGNIDLASPSSSTIGDLQISLHPPKASSIGNQSAPSKNLSTHPISSKAPSVQNTRPSKPIISANSLMGSGPGAGFPMGTQGIRTGLMSVGNPLLNGSKLQSGGEQRLPTSQKVSITTTPLTPTQQQLQNFNQLAIQNALANMYNPGMNFYQFMFQQQQHQQHQNQQRGRVNRQSAAFPIPVPGYPNSHITEQMFAQFRMAEQQAVAARTGTSVDPGGASLPSSSTPNPLFPVRQIQLVNAHTNGGSP